MTLCNQHIQMHRLQVLCEGGFVSANNNRALSCRGGCNGYMRVVPAHVCPFQ
jgi:hypothetical protein